MGTNNPPSNLASVMDRHPQLTTHGIGVYSAETLSSTQRRTQLHAGRQTLIEREAHVMTIADWLRRNITAIDKPTIDSYRMKHVTEKALGQYVANGELIAAALIVGYTTLHKGGPNLLLGMSERDVKRALEASGPGNSPTGEL